jgi:hypothetical protein
MRVLGERKWCGAVKRRKCNFQRPEAKSHILGQMGTIF